MRLSAPPSSAG